MNSPDLQSRPTLSRGCRLKVEGEASVLLFPEGLLRLSRDATSVLRLCDGQRTIEEILDQLKSSEPPTVATRIESETIDFLSGLMTRALVGTR